MQEAAGGAEAMDTDAAIGARAVAASTASPAVQRKPEQFRCARVVAARELKRRCHVRSFLFSGIADAEERVRLEGTACELGGAILETVDGATDYSRLTHLIAGEPVETFAFAVRSG